VLLALAPLSLAGCAVGPGRDRADPQVALAPLPQPLDIPFHLDRQRIIVDVALNGQRRFPFVLDTGLTDGHLLTGETAATLGIAPGGQARGFDSAGRSFALREASLDDVALGGLSLGSQPAVVLDLPPLVMELMQGRRLGGVLGDVLLERFALTLDFDQGLLTLWPGAPPPDPRATVLPLVWRGNLLTTVVEIDDRPAVVLVDTGDFHTLTLYEDAARRHGVEPHAGPALEVIGAAGPYPLQRAELPGLGLGGLQIGPLPAAIAPRGPGLPDFLAGRIGIGLLSRFRVGMDTQMQRLTLGPRTPPGAPHTTTALTVR